MVRNKKQGITDRSEEMEDICDKITSATTTYELENIEQMIGLSRSEESYQETADRLEDTIDIYERLEKRWFEIEKE